MSREWQSRFKIVAITASLTACASIVLGLWWHSDRNTPLVPAGFYGVSTDFDGSRAGPRNAVTGRADGLASNASASRPGHLIIPVAGVKPETLTDTFTQAREGGARIHDAIDILAPLGTPVLAAAGGSVEKLFFSDAGGKTIYIRSPDRERMYYYAHLDDYAPGLSEGMVVRRGQPIGTAGYSGNASAEAPHLHFEIMATAPQLAWSERKSTLNPYPLLSRAGSQ